jgi:hypothetical protein
LRIPKSRLVEDAPTQAKIKLILPRSVGALPPVGSDAQGDSVHGSMALPWDGTTSTRSLVGR